MKLELAKYADKSHLFIVIFYFFSFFKENLEEKLITFLPREIHLNLLQNILKDNKFPN